VRTTNLTQIVTRWGTGSLYVTWLRYLSFLNTKCNVLGYWRRRSVCYSVYYDLTSRHYSLVLQCALTLWRCVSERSWFLCSGPWISCYLVFCVLSVFLFICVFSLLWFRLLCSVKVKVKGTLRLTVSQSVSLGVEPHLQLMHDQIFITVWQLRSCNERTGLSFVYAAGPCQRSFSRVRVPWDSRPYFTVSDLRLPILSPPTTRRITVEVFDPVSSRVDLSMCVLPLFCCP
jgi:hypothetical protein